MVAIKKADKPKPRRRSGEGGITQVKSGPHKGMYRATVELERDALAPDVRRTKKVSSMDFDTLVEKMEAAKAEKRVNGGDLPTSGITVSEWMAYWMKEINKSRPGTRKSYRASIRYIDLAIGNIKLDKLTPADVRKIERLIVDTKGLTSTTALHAFHVLNKALQDAMREGGRIKVHRNVASLVTRPRVSPPKLKEMTSEEAIAVLRSVEGTRLGSRYAAALLTGARQGELIGLEINRVNFVDNIIDMSWQMQSISWSHAPTCHIVETYPQDKAARRPLYSCGAKRSNECPERWLDAPTGWEHRYITGSLYWSRPKSAAGLREIPLVEPLRSILKERIRVANTEPNPYGLVWTQDPQLSLGGRRSHRTLRPLSGLPLAPSPDNKGWHKALADTVIYDDATGLPVLDESGENLKVTDVRLHDARHTAITLLYDLDVPEISIQAIVGHSAAAQSRKYRNKSAAQRRKNAEAMMALGAALKPQEIAPAALVVREVTA